MIRARTLPSQTVSNGSCCQSARGTRILLELLDNPREANECMVAALNAMPVESLPDQAVVRVDQESFDYFLSVLDEPPSGPGFERLMQTPRPWDS